MRIRIRMVLAAAVFLVSACSSTAGRETEAPSASLLPSPPPATSGIDHTVSVRWQLADSFDIAPDGSCTGRDTFGGMGAAARVQLRGATTGMVDETRATARVEDQTRSRSAQYDDGRYCVIRIVFAPALPDPDGYFLKFPDSSQTELRVGTNPLLGPSFIAGKPARQPELPPGYGETAGIGSQACPSLLDPPDKACAGEVR
jgi:hypothetical protein